jgi:ketosteroid isomerase-like protein
MSSRHQRLVCAIAAAVAACTANDPATALKGSKASGRTDRASARPELFAADASLSDSIVKLGSVDGTVMPMREDAIYLAEGLAAIRGKREVREALAAEYRSAPASNVSRTLGGGDASSDGRFGFTFGWLQRKSASSDRPESTSYATYVCTWTRSGRQDPFRVAVYYLRASVGPHSPVRDGFPLLANGPGAAGVPRPGTLEQQKRSLLAVDREFAAYSVTHGYTLAFAEYAADFTMPFGRNFYFLTGRQEVLDFYKGWTPAELLEWTPLFADSSESGDLGYTVGTSVTTTTKADGTVDRAYNKYLSLWARRADGSWKFVADGGSVAPAPSPGPSISEGLSRVQTKPPKRPGAVE